MAFEQVKNLQPKVIALYVSLVLALLVGVLDFIFFQNLIRLIASFLSVFVFGYLLFYYTLEIFIYRKIKLVYKNIHNLKLGKETKESLGEGISNNPLTDVENEVADWEKNKKSEIEDL